jgi:hypothetical protein
VREADGETFGGTLAADLALDIEDRIDALDRLLRLPTFSQLPKSQS